MKSTYDVLGIPDAVAGVFVALALIILLAPYAAGKDFGIFIVPDFGDRARKPLKLAGPLFLLLVVVCFFPLWKPTSPRYNIVTLTIETNNSTTEAIELDQYCKYYLTHDNGGVALSNVTSGRAPLNPLGAPRQESQLSVPAKRSRRFIVEVPKTQTYQEALTRGTSDIHVVISTKEGASYNSSIAFVVGAPDSHVLKYKLVDKTLSLDVVLRQPALELINARSAQSEARSPNPITVAIVSTGVAELPHFGGRLLKARSFSEHEPTTKDDSGLGTAMASIIAAIAPTAKILPLKMGWSLTSDIEAIRYARQRGARVVLIHAPPSSIQAFAPIRREIEEARANGVLVILPAGNDGTPVKEFRDAIVIGATDVHDALAGFTNVGPGVDFMAPGVNVTVLERDGRPDAIPGTTIASSVVAGVAALALSTRPELSAEELESILRNSSHALETERVDAGRVDALAAVRLAKGYLHNPVKEKN